MLMKQEIKPEKIDLIVLNTNGSDKCMVSPVLINGIEPGKGIKEIQLILVSDKKPLVTIIGVPYLIPSKVKEAWGLNDSEWKDIADGEVTINVNIEGVPENVLPLDYLVNNQAEE